MQSKSDINMLHQGEIGAGEAFLGLIDRIVNAKMQALRNELNTNLPKLAVQAVAEHQRRTPGR